MPGQLQKRCATCLDPFDGAEAVVEADPESMVYGMDVHPECRS